MRHLQAILQICLLTFLTISAHAEPSCFILVKQLEKKKSTADSNGGMWGYYEKSQELRDYSAHAIQLDSRINKIFFALYYLCETEKGIPLNDLATYISRNLSVKGKNEFRSELLLIGKTHEQIDTWFEFYRYAINHTSRTLIFSKIRNALDQSSLLVDDYVQLAIDVSQEESSEDILKKTQALITSMNKLLTQQPYLAQALNEISHVPFWDTNESTGGS